MSYRPLDLILAVTAVGAAAAATYFGFRHGSTYTIGDSTYTRDSDRDDLLVALPAAWLVVTSVILLIRRLNPQGIRAEWQREREELREARAYRRPSRYP